MGQYFLSENLKIKNTFLKKLTWFMPMLTILLSMFLAQDYFQVDSYNWWYIMMLPGTVSLSCALLSRIDGAMKNRAILSLSIDLKKVWIAKVLVGVKNLAISCMIIFVSAQLSPLIIKTQGVTQISLLSGLAAALILIITVMWQVPLCLFLGNKIGLFPTTLINLLMNIIFTIIAVEKYWWVMPFSYPARLMCPVLKILPNGLVAKPGSQTFTPEVLHYWVVPFAIIVSILLFVGITYLTARWYKKREEV